MNEEQELQDLRKQLDKVILGERVVLQKLAKGTIKKLYIARNCKQTVIAEVENLSKIGDFSVVKLSVDNDELGTICKKPFSVSIIGVPA